MGEEYIPEVDTSYGLIYRLNYLWAKVDRDALGGDFDKWELVLDRIFSNLLYREDIGTEENEDEEIKNVYMSNKDVGVWKKVKQKITEVKQKKFQAMRNRKPQELMQAKLEHYNALMLYDIWLRKFMQSLRLYMKEATSNPSGALFGARFGKRR